MLLKRLEFNKMKFFTNHTLYKFLMENTLSKKSLKSYK